MVEISNNWVLVIGALVVWDLIWKALAMWRAGQNEQKVWFGALLVINSVGIVPIIYLLIAPKPHVER